MSYVHTRKDYGSGIIGKIVHDEGRSDLNPMEDNDAALMFVFHRRYVNPAEKTAKTPEDMRAWAKEHPEWEEYPLFMYDHSGTIYRVSRGGNPFSCPWDSGRVGSLFLKKKKWGGYGQQGAADTRFEIAQNICKNYTSWANGEVFGYVIEDEDGEHLDSCWGFIGDPDGYVTEEMDSAAKHYVEKAQERQAEELEDERADMYAGGAV